MRKFFAAFLILVILLPSLALAEGPEPSEDNLLSNADFSDSSELVSMPSAWSFTAYRNDAENVDASVVLEDQDAFVEIQNYAKNDARIYQDVDIESNVTYCFFAEIKTKSVQSGQGATLSIDNYGFDGCYCYSDSVIGTSDWTPVELYFHTGAGQKTVRCAFRLGGYGAESIGTAWFRNARLYAVTETQDAEVIDLANAAGTAATRESSPEHTADVTIFVLSTLVCVAFAALYALLYRGALRSEGASNADPNHPRSILCLIFAIAFALRLVLSLIFRGHATDIACFMAWGNAVAANGTSTFYTSGMFADYPPGYMYLCGAISWICRLLGLSYGGAGMLFLFKLPAIVADLLSAYLAYHIAKEEGVRKGFALLLAALLAFDPTAMFISGAWGQIDSLLTLGIVFSFYLFQKDRLIWAGMVYGLAILIKPQALMFGPLFAVAYIRTIILSTDRKKTIIETLLAVFSAFAVLFVLSLPFKGNQPFGWLIQKYAATANSYQYATIEAFNFAALLGYNWKPVDIAVLGIPYSAWGTAFISLAVALGTVLLLFAPYADKDGKLRLRFLLSRGKSSGNKGTLYLAAACMLGMIFTFGHFMHERYLFPILLLILIAYAYLRDRRLLISFCGSTVILLFNVLFAMFIVNRQELRGALYDGLTRVGAAFEILNFVYLLWLTIDILVLGCVKKPTDRGKTAQVFSREPHESIRTTILPSDSGSSRLRYSRLEWVMLCVLTGVYGVVALTNLGTLSAPQTFWAAETAQEQVTISFPQETKVSEYWVYGNIQNSGVLLLQADQGHEETFEQLYDNMFRWQRVETSFTTREVVLRLYSGAVKINEIAFFDAQGHRIDAAVLAPSGSQAALLDEQDTVPEKPSYYNGMYFDELYHARTAYEHLHNLAPYENSHPPLGKLIIALGIAIFGMNPFGWRVMGTLFGIAMLPILFAFGKRVFKKFEYAFLCTSLFAFDFMHFTQTRIATIDVYAVFFILLMYYCMYQYISMNFYVDGLKRTLKPLALSGVFFGLGIACKWTCCYAGAGLAVLFFGSLIERWMEHRKAAIGGTKQETEQVAVFSRNAVKTLLWCCLFFLLIPFLIYFSSYIPYYKYEMQLNADYGLGDAFRTFGRYQEFMYSYHSGLTATHPYQSSWWEWPFTARPMWYYFGSDPASGTISTLTASGNPAVWWISTLGALTLFGLRLAGRIKPDRALWVFFIGLLANYLPWVLVPRCTFIYHFFATVPFILMSTVYLLERVEEQHPSLSSIKWVWLCIAVGLFILLYPGLSGLPITKEWAAIIKKLPGGLLMYGA